MHLKRGGWLGQWRAGVPLLESCVAEGGTRAGEKVGHPLQYLGEAPTLQNMGFLKN